MFSVQSLALPNGEGEGLSRFEQDAGWISLFDGHSSAGWRGIGKPTFPEKGWDIDKGCLHHIPQGGGGDLVTSELFGDFELEFEWKVAPGANSGVKYRVRDEPGSGSAFGPEYQVLDDQKHANGKLGKTSAGSLYDVIPAEKAQAPHVGGFNLARIVCRGDRIEHWLNGEQLFVVDPTSDQWTEQLAASKFKGREDFASSGLGRIALQDHGDEVWFRNIRLRELPGPADREFDLYNGADLSSWREYGDADYSAEGDSILGKVGGGGQSFLISKDHFGDFIFEVDVKTEEPGNSGIQIRTHERDNKRPFGYQIEIDPSDRSWSGGLYDEARRGWLQNLEHNPAGRAAFVYQEWNQFRIEAIGPWFKVRVNGVPTTDYFDTEDLEGFLALQVHSGNNTRVRWRQPRLWDLGVRRWQAASLPPSRVVQDLAWVAEGESYLGLPQQGSAQARRYPVLKFEAMVAGGELHVLLQDEAPANGVPHQCPGVEGAIAAARPGGWCVRVNASKTFKPKEWNQVSVGFDGDRCALQVNGRTEEMRRMQPELNGSRLFLVSVGEQAQVELKSPMLLGDPNPR